MTSRQALQRPAPHDDDAERAFLGGLSFFPERLGAVGGALMPKHFYRPAHQTLFQAMLDLVAEGAKGPLDHVLVLDRCRRADPQNWATSKSLGPRVRFGRVRTIGAIWSHRALGASLVALCMRAQRTRQRLQERAHLSFGGG